jgi:hypothetical protein
VRSLKAHWAAFELICHGNLKNFPATVECPRNIQLYGRLNTEDGCGRHGS